MVCKMIAGAHKAIGVVILHMVKVEKEAKSRWVMVMACRVIAGAHKAIGTRRSKCR